MRDRVAVFTVFALNGLAVGSWATRTPALTAQVHASPGVFGLALFGASVGMLLTASVSGRVVERAGARAAVAGSTLVAAAALVLIGFAPGVAVLAAALFVIGGSIGILDVAMNVAAVAVERRSRRPVLPVFHAGFSFGALAGSLAAGLAAGHGWSPARHLAVAAVVAVVVLLSVIRAVPGSRPEPTAEPVVTPWRAAPVRRPVLWLLAAVALCSAIAEGAAGDWSALLMTAERGVGPGAAALAFAGFQLAMTLTRLAGPWVQRRFGPTRCLVAGAALAAAGLLATAVTPVAAVGYAGFALAGAGLAASFPLTLSLAGDAGKRADGTGGEREIGFVTAIAYAGYLGGPPVIGGIAQAAGYGVAFLFVTLVAALIPPAAVAARRARLREEARQAAG
ncbi:major facilitator transporter [Amycolatopsis mediterranei S699]|uniref:Major facilitator transporter n=3 Tax=Amycolatopsis mediterranei TaxID=33910 RepID=A0A0H3DE98_AMYMU|nr:MFS transporter [Amycolatopsis mediterranei]ADJ48557.1 major facilitator transporter [Amycolatopsis mediterranei U32]AEK45486.1 major facilitator transporter [Amycolatopsis mediterranei S699]AFO80266.1 major facilitator transporter [Amycolatopsis mediterranei S699]AGT87394.1 major facilitator transporter [Amycolatopsis mediterranei RB]KDO11052.1 MFS transporter [Amycolatopsis mediterranei]